MPKGTPKYIELIDEFEMAAIANATKGGGHPDDMPLKEQDYKTAKKKLIAFIKTNKKESKREGRIDGRI